MHFLWGFEGRLTSGRPSTTQQIFVDRIDAGRRLAATLQHLRGPDVTVLGLPRGGVPVASEVANALGSPLDVIVVRKLGLPRRPEVAMGAIGEGDIEVFDHRLIALHNSEQQLRAIEGRERRRINTSIQRFRGGDPPLDLQGRLALIVDDGLATGATARVACRVARARGARRIVVALPVGPASVSHAVPEADEVICLHTPTPFASVGSAYRNFRQTTDDEVVELLNAARTR